MALSDVSYETNGRRRTERGDFRPQNRPMSNSPWIDPTELDELAARYASLPRSRIELVLEAYWPIKHDVERALLELVALQQRNDSVSLDYTR
jgi:hypothetical protein